MEWCVANETETALVAQELAPLLKKGDVVLLNGTLGVGKTTFVRALIRYLLKSETEVPSPTYTLLQMYDTSQFTIYHFDFYRLKTPEEAYEVGIEDAFSDGVSMIEWPDKISPLIPQNHKTISFQLLDDGTRKITAEGF